jgi:hypothetical protein
MNGMLDMTEEEGIELCLRRSDLSAPMNDGDRADAAELTAYRAFQTKTKGEQ